MGVQKSAYRQPVTPEGLKAIEEGKLTWLDDEMYNNLNTGVLEQYLEEKNLQESFEVSHWSTPKVLYGIAIGAVFSGVTAYIGLKIGMAVSAAWYVAYLLGMALKWSPSEVNISTSATTGATNASIGFIFTFPAIFLKSGINLLIDINLSPACGITKAPEFNSDSNAAPFASVPNSCAYINARPLVTPDISVAGAKGLIGVVELLGSKSSA